MKRILKKLQPRKMDEMERYILSKAQRNAYLFLVAALMVWSFYESWQVYAWHGRLNLSPCMLLVAAALVQTFSRLILTRRAVQGDEDSFETGPLVKIVVLTCAVAGVAATIGAAIVLLCMRV